MSRADPPSLEFRSYLRRMYRSRLGEALDPHEEADRERYMPLLDPETDPVRRIDAAIRQGDVQGISLVAGVRGVGRSTGLAELSWQREQAGDVVVGVDLEGHLSPNGPVRVLEVVAALVGGVDDALTAGLLHGEVGGVSTWERLGRLLPAEVQRHSGVPRAARVRELLRGLGPEEPRLGPILAGAADSVRVMLGERYDELLGDLRRVRGRGMRLVVVAQGLERFTPAPGEAGEPTDQGTVSRMLLTSGNLLALPETHVVASVPASVWWVRGALEATIPLCSVAWWPALPVRDREGQPDPDSIGRMVALVERRGDWRRLFEDRERLESLVLASGGVVRELMALLREAILAAPHERRGGLVERARSARRQAYLAMLPPGSRGALAEVSRTGRIDGPEQLARCLPLLQDGLLVGYPEGDGDGVWFDVHPHLRDAAGRLA